jgi:glycosyltransferase involved in cell wall biosynthesis
LQPDPDRDAAAYNLRYAVRLHEIEDGRRHTVDELAASQRQFEDALVRFRNQRSWQLFLLARKLYAHSFLEGWAGRRELLRFLSAAPFKGIPNLAKYDLVPPKIEAFLPKPLASPYFSHSPGQRAVRTGEATRDSPYDLVILPVFGFNYRFQRPQHLAVQFASYGHRVFWISPNKFLDSDSPHSFEITPLCANLWEVRLREVIPDIYMEALSAAQVTGLVNCVSDCLRQNNIQRSCVLVQFPFWRQIGLELRRRFGSLLAFDCMDEWQTFPRVGDFARTEQPLLLQEADLLIVTARALESEFRAAQLGPLRIPNGVDFDLFREASTNDALHPMPVVGYTGAIADWFDFDLLEAVALARPQYSFVIVGAFEREQHVSGPAVERLRQLSNIHLLGHKPFAEVPPLLAGFDVCTIPFVVNRVTEATNPVKMYEYLAAGKPIVSTPLAEVSALGPPYAYVGATVSEFASQIDRALVEDTPSKRDQRAAFAASNSWTDRYKMFDAAIRSKLK